MERLSRPPNKAKRYQRQRRQRPAAGGESSWVKVCDADEKTGNKQVCLIRHEGLDPKTGALLISVAVRTIEGEDKKHLLVNVPTAYSLVIPAGVQVKIDEGEPIQLQYAVCFPTSCQVQMELSKEIVDKMRKGKQMVVAALNAQQKTMAFPFPLSGFSKTFDGPPVDNVAYQEARAQMMRASREHQAELAKEAAEARIRQQVGAQPQSGRHGGAAGRAQCHDRAGTSISDAHEIRRA